MEILSCIGAPVCTSSGNYWKRTLVRTMSQVPAAISSRTTHFAEHISLHTLSLGVAHVLNSLTSAGMVAATLAAMTPYAHFAEIGKRNIWSTPQRVWERPDALSSIIAVDFLPPVAVHNEMMRLAVQLCVGSISAITSIVFLLSEVCSAMRMMSQASHAGKLVVRKPASALSLNSGTIMITGGTGGLGLLMCKWAVENIPGAALMLSGRTGRLPAECSDSKRAQVSQSFVSLYQSDVAGLESGKSLNDASSQYKPALTGVLHASGVLQDGALRNTTASSVRKVHAPKARALDNVQSTVVAGLPVRAVVLFSSITALLGSVGQSNYTASNAMLDSAAQCSQSCGFAFLSIQWGAWSSSGMAARSVQVMKRMDRIGFGLLPPEQGLSALEGFTTAMHARAGANTHPLVIVTASPLNVTKLCTYQPDLHEFLCELFQSETEAADNQLQDASVNLTKATGTRGKGGPDLALSSDPKARQEYLEKTVGKIVSRVLNEEIGTASPLMAAGVDSLGASELRNLMARELGLDLPGTLIFDYPTGMF